MHLCSARRRDHDRATIMTKAKQNCRACSWLLVAVLLGAPLCYAEEEWGTPQELKDALNAGFVFKRTSWDDVMSSTPAAPQHPM